MKNEFITLLKEGLPLVGIAFIPITLFFFQEVFSDVLDFLEIFVYKQHLFGNINWKAAH